MLVFRLLINDENTFLVREFSLLLLTNLSFLRRMPIYASLGFTSANVFTHATADFDQHGYLLTVSSFMYYRSYLLCNVASLQE